MNGEECFEHVKKKHKRNKKRKRRDENMENAEEFSASDFSLLNMSDNNIGLFASLKTSEEQTDSTRKSKKKRKKRSLEREEMVVSSLDESSLSASCNTKHNHLPISNSGILTSDIKKRKKKHKKKKKEVNSTCEVALTSDLKNTYKDADKTCKQGGSDITSHVNFNARDGNTSKKKKKKRKHSEGPNVQDISLDSEVSFTELQSPNKKRKKTKQAFGYDQTIPSYAVSQSSNDNGRTESTEKNITSRKTAPEKVKDYKTNSDTGGNEAALHKTIKGSLKTYDGKSGGKMLHLKDFVTDVWSSQSQEASEHNTEVTTEHTHKTHKKKKWKQQRTDNESNRDTSLDSEVSFGATSQKTSTADSVQTSSDFETEVNKQQDPDINAEDKELLAIRIQEQGFKNSIKEYKMLLKQGANVNKGKWRKAEEQQLLVNWESYFKAYPVPFPTDFLQINSLKPSERAAIKQQMKLTDFWIKIGHKIPRHIEALREHLARLLLREKSASQERFSPDEDKKLLALQSLYNNDWARIALCLEKNRKDVWQRYISITQTKTSSGTTWSEEADRRLREAVDLYSNGEAYDWDAVSKYVKKRACECSIRWSCLVAT